MGRHEVKCDQKEQQACDALRWIVKILRKHRIPFHVTGGLAARSYGSKRLLNDIDIDVPDERIVEIIPDVQEFIVFGPERENDGCWDLFLLTLCYNGQNIDISGADSLRICHAHTGEWMQYPCDFTQDETQIVLGMELPVMCRDHLVAYKEMLVDQDNMHQQEDIDAIRAV